MASLGMGSSYLLSSEEIERVVLKDKIGNYAYGYLNGQGRFVVRYVGRSDSDLQERLKHGIADMQEDPSCNYERFKFSYAATPQEAYEKECQNYHDFGGEKGFLRNERHPAKPDGCNGVCPICGE